MGQKAITIYTPDSATPHIYAEDDAQIHRALIGSSGITLTIRFALRPACIPCRGICWRYSQGQRRI